MSSLQKEASLPLLVRSTTSEATENSTLQDSWVRSMIIVRGAPQLIKQTTGANPRRNFLKSWPLAKFLLHVSHNYWNIIAIFFHCVLFLPPLDFSSETEICSQLRDLWFRWTWRVLHHMDRPLRSQLVLICWPMPNVKTGPVDIVRKVCKVKMVKNANRIWKFWRYL